MLSKKKKNIQVISAAQSLGLVNPSLSVDSLCFHLVSGRNGKLHDQKLFQNTDGHSRRTSQVTSRESLRNRHFIARIKTCLLSVCRSVGLSVCLPACLSVCLSAYLYTYLSIYLSIYLSVCLYLYVCLSIYPPIHPSVYLLGPLPFLPILPLHRRCFLPSFCFSSKIQYGN